VSFSRFKSTFSAEALSRYEKEHYFLQVISGFIWGSSCFLLLNAEMPLHDDLRVTSVLCVIVAYSASVMSGSLKGMLSYVVPLWLCMLAYFAINLGIYQWWFFANVLLGVSCGVFGYINHHHVRGQIESQQLNARYISELNEMKTSMQEANLNLVNKNETLLAVQKRLELLAIKDEMTGVFNRRYAMELLKKSILGMERHKEDYVVVLADIDLFKKINDTFGHASGDKVIRGFAQLLKQELRQIDSVARYGGEEFLIVLPKTNMTAAKKIIQRLCDMTAQKHYTFSHKQIIVTASFGMAQYQIGDTVEKLIDRADQALYQAKKSGRNNVKVFKEKLKTA
jgi:diguanylate cyclase (GGDEF)-like protein